LAQKKWIWKRKSHPIGHSSYSVEHCFSSLFPRNPEVPPIPSWVLWESSNWYYFEYLGSSKCSILFESFRDLKKVEKQWRKTTFLMTPCFVMLWFYIRPCVRHFFPKFLFSRVSEIAVFWKLGSEQVFRAFSELVPTRSDPNFCKKNAFFREN